MMSGSEILCQSHALLHPQTALAAVETLRGCGSQAAVDGLVELIYRGTSVRPTLAAIDALEHSTSPLVADAFVAGLLSPNATVRLAAVQALHRRAATAGTELVRLLHQDGSWPVRRAALLALAEQPGDPRWHVLYAATDPHWRVRHALLKVLLSWGHSPTDREDIQQRLTRLGTDERTQGLCAYLQWRWEARLPEEGPGPEEADPRGRCEFWDWDAAVLARNLERLGPAGRQQAVAVMPFLLEHSDERVRERAMTTLAEGGTNEQLAEALALLGEPRNRAGEAVCGLLGTLNLDRTETLARFLLHLPGAVPAQLTWALDQVGPVFPPEEEQETLLGFCQEVGGLSAVVRCALARLASRWDQSETVRLLQRFLQDDNPMVQAEALRTWNCRKAGHLDMGLLHRLLGSTDAAVRVEAVPAALAQACDRNQLAPLLADPDYRVRQRLAEVLATLNADHYREWLASLRADLHPHVRAAALTDDRAAELVRAPARETSWHVLARAARLRRVPLWKLLPAQPWTPSVSSAVPAASLSPLQPDPPFARLLGPERLAVAPLGISGHYGLPVAGFVRAMEAGVNLLFWEPSYHTLTDFFHRLTPSGQRALHLLAGTFEADGQRIRRDAERILRVLGIEQVSFFFLFWVQSWDRIIPEVRDTLERLRSEGKIRAFGLSTHSRTLALEAMQEGWNPVMVRHSAAHRGAEQQVFPRAATLGVDLITFSNTCYGRLLQPRGGLPAPHPADCYRYTLEQPAVRACFAAPATVEQLDQNLETLSDPFLPEERRRLLQSSGAMLYQEEAIFRRFVRSR